MCNAAGASVCPMSLSGCLLILSNTPAQRSDRSLTSRTSRSVSASKPTAAERYPRNVAQSYLRRRIVPTKAFRAPLSRAHFSLFCTNLVAESQPTSNECLNTPPLAGQKPALPMRGTNTSYSA